MPFFSAVTSVFDSFSCDVDDTDDNDGDCAAAVVVVEVVNTGAVFLLSGYTFVCCSSEADADRVDADFYF